MQSDGIDYLMFVSILGLYTNSELIRIFKRETEFQVDDVYVQEFKSWLKRIFSKENGGEDRMLPRDYHIWILQKMHEYSRVNR